MFSMLSKNITLYRKNAGMTQEKLAERLNITRQAVSKWESGASVPDALMLAEICRVLEITPNDLLDFHTEPVENHTKCESIILRDRKYYYLFLLLLFIGGVVLLIFNFYGSMTFEPNMTIVAIFMMCAAILLFIISMRRHDMEDRFAANIE